MKKDEPNNDEIRDLLEIIKKVEEYAKQVLTPVKRKIKKLRRRCKPHDFEKIMFFDQSYSPRADGVGAGQDVLKEKRCKECWFSIPVDKDPWEQCWKCGDKMDLDRFGNFATNQTEIFKCQKCGHEYEKA